jgi:hypothetical protein
MRLLLTLVVLTGLSLSIGCGKDKRVEAPTNVPPPPKGPPTADGKSSNQGKPSDAVAPVSP